MAEYSLDTSLAPELWETLDAFTQGYIEAAMWTLTDTWFECNECGAHPSDRNEGRCSTCGTAGSVHEHTESADHLGLHDIAAETIDRAREDCATFIHAYRTLLNEASDEQPHRDDSHHGHDFWLTRNGHGAGFWDRGYSDALSDSLTRGAKGFGSCDWYVGSDGNVYQQ